MHTLTVEPFWRVDEPERCFGAGYRNGYETEIATLELDLPTFEDDEARWLLIDEDDGTIEGSVMATKVECDAELMRGCKLLLSVRDEPDPHQAAAIRRRAERAITAACCRLADPALDWAATQLGELGYVIGPAPDPQHARQIDLADGPSPGSER